MFGLKPLVGSIQKSKKQSDARGNVSGTLVQPPRRDIDSL
jgi:hypothetical protein